MRHSYKTFALAVIAVASMISGCEAMADGFVPPVHKFEIAQAPATAPSTPLAELLERASALMAFDKPLLAYQLLAGAEDTYIGVVEFDYALGRAALDAGRPDKATLAFSRVLARDPGHVGAMIDTGRAYLALGNYTQARATFEGLLALDPPPAVRTQLQAYLEQARQARPRGSTPRTIGQDLPTQSSGPSHRGYLGAIVGRSTNVNQSPGQPQVFVPAFGTTFELSNQNVKKADGFTGIMGGADAALPLNGTYSLIGGGEFVDRWNNHESSFDTGGYGARLGIAAANETDLLRLQFLAGRDYLASSPSRDMNALALDYLHLLGSGLQFVAYAQSGRLRYVPEDLKIFDTNFVIGGLGVSAKIAEDSTAFVTFSTGELNDIGGNVSGDRRQLGFRAGVDAAILPRLRLMGNIGGERGIYDQVDPSFLVERRDWRTGYEAVLQYALERNTFLRWGVTYTDQRSNIPVYVYDRREWWMMLRFEF